MQQLPVLPARGTETSAALVAKRDELLRWRRANPPRLQAATRALALRCVTETLRLTGVAVSLPEVEQVLWTPEATASARQSLIVGQWKALEALRRQAAEGRALAASLIRDVHRLSSPPDGGRFRSGSAPAQFAGARPSPAEQVSAQMNDLIGWLRVPSVRSLRMPERAALGLMRLLEIAPFERGNFRLAHLLMNFFAFEEDYAPFFFRSEEAEAVRQEMERAFRFDTLPLVSRLARSQSASLDYCLRLVRDGVSG